MRSTPNRDSSFAHRNGWDREYLTYPDDDLPSYVGGGTTFRRLPLVEDPAELRRRAVDVAIVGAPIDEAVSHRPGARFGPRAIRTAYYGTGHPYSIQLDVAPFAELNVVDAGDANVTPAWLERAHALIYRKVHEIAATGTIPFILGGDHSATWPAATAVSEVRGGRIGVVHFDAHADTAPDEWGVPAGHGTPIRRLIESGAIRGANFVQVGLRGYWPPPSILGWMREQGMRWHPMTEIEDRGADAVIADAIEEALEGADAVYLSIDVDVLDPGMAPGTGTPEPGGMLTREMLRAVRRIATAVDIAGMDVVEVSPPYDVAEVTAAAAHRMVLEALSALAVKKRAGRNVRYVPASAREALAHEAWTLDIAASSPAAGPVTGDGTDVATAVRSRRRPRG